jgi:apolipoprotein N-acyltransferase
MNKKTYIPYVWLALGAAGLFFTGGKYNFFPAAWISNIFLIRYTRSQKPGIGYLFAGISAWLVVMVSWYGIQPMSGLAYAISMLVTALISALPLLADRLLVRRLPGWLGTLVFPAVATAVEYALISANPMGSFGAVAYSQFAFGPFLQFASIGGLTGMAFLLYWFPSLVNFFWEKSWKLSKPLLFTAMSLYTAVILFGVIQLSVSNDPSDTVEVSMIIRGDGETNLRSVLGPGTYSASAAEKLLKGLEEKTVTEAASGSRIISWPEGSVVVPANELLGMRDRLSRLSRETGVYLVAPYIVLSDGSYENGLDVYSPTGEVVLNHVKYGGNIVEGSVPGNRELGYVDTEFGRLSAAVCWDMDFPDVLKQAGSDSVDIMVSPSCEWLEIVPTHAQMAVFRGVENGMVTVHPASLGLSLAADSRGRVLGSLNWFESDEAVLRVKVPVGGVSTPYARFGEVFGPVSIALSVLLILHGAFVAILARKKRKAGKKD